MKWFSLLLAPSILAAASLAQDAKIMRSYDLEDFRLVEDEGRTFSMSYFVPWVFYDFEDKSKLPREMTGNDYVVDALEGLLEPMLSDHGAELRVLSDSRLVVSGSQAVHEAVESLLGRLRSIVTATYEVRVDLVKWDTALGAEALPKSMMSAGEADAFIASARQNGARVRTLTGPCQPGATATFDASKASSYLADFDVEIASHSMIADPIVMHLEHGQRLMLRLSPGAEGVNAAYYLSSRDLLEITRLPVQMNGRMGIDPETPVVISSGQNPFAVPQQTPVTPPTKTGVVEGPSFIEAPVVRTHSVGGEAALAVGGALCLSSSFDYAGKTSTDVVIVRLVGDSSNVQSWTVLEEQSQAKVTAINLLRFSPARIDFEGLPSSQISQLNDQAGYGDVDVSFRRPDFDWVIEEMSQGLRLMSWSGSWAFVRVDPNWHPDAASNYALLKSLPADRDVSDLTLDCTGLGRAALRLPVASNGSFGASVGLHMAKVADYHVEVAQGSSVADPYVFREFSGVQMGGRLSGDSIRTSGFAQWTETDKRSVDIAGGIMGPIQMSEVRRVDLNERRVVADGAPETYGQAAEGGTSVRIVRR